ncbi:MAG: antitoxin [Desulfuromonadales bacterium GWD2_61_12]|nr:MAG: antitoxin [Desulfuromonadales bacterium GWC2_61_20]OGR34100.1 MAG: antitoxin [Desulfuromonadales bacterium GWD2_61_12]HAD04795.1 antitoxin [Desulfuromonas sp.]HBT82314.1 antitoxin [Desulfuromonas sp.]
MDLEHLYRASLEKWGREAQFDQAVEECAELIAVLKHYRRDKADATAVIAELADVTLMVGQLTWMLGEDEVRAAVAEKSLKLESLLAR